MLNTGQQENIKTSGAVFWTYTSANKCFSLYRNDHTGKSGMDGSTIVSDKNVFAAIHPEDRKDVLEFLENHGSHKTLLTYRVLLSSGESRWMKTCGQQLNGQKKAMFFGWTSGFEDAGDFSGTPRLGHHQTLLGLNESYLVVNTSGEILSSAIGKKEKVILETRKNILYKNYSAVLVPLVARKLSDLLLSQCGDDETHSVVEFSNGGTFVKIDIRLTRIGEEAVLVNFRNLYDRVGNVSSAEKFYAFTEQSNELIIITNTEGKIEYANPMVTKVTGYSSSELIGRKISIFKSGKHQAGFYRDLWETISAGKVFKAEFHNLKKDGEIFVEEKVITPLCDQQGRVSSFISTGREITAKYRKEQRESKYRQLQMAMIEKEQKSRTLSLIKRNEIERKKVAHSLHEDLSQMLSAAMVNLESLGGKEVLNKEERSKLGLVNQLVSEIIKELRGISSDLSPINLYQFGLLPVVKQMVTHTMRSRPDLQIELNSDLDGKRFKSDVEINVYRIMQEAIQNVLQHSGANKLAIHLSYLNGSLLLSVIDNGRGINLNTLEFKKMSTFGILNLEARAKSIGATLSINSRLQKGFVIDLSLNTKLLTL